MPDRSLPYFSMFETATDRGTLLTLTGELDVGAAGQTAEALARHLSIGQPVTVDLSDVVFIDSSGLSALVMAARTPEQRALLTLLPSRHAQPLDLLRTTGTQDFFRPESAAG